MDIFKLEDGKIVKHWDVIRPMPESAINQNGMFWMDVPLTTAATAACRLVAGRDLN